MAKSILIVEDDQAIREMYRLKFESEGFKVDLAENGKRGLEVAQKNNPEMILLDLMMPEMRGDEMLKKIRSSDWGKDIKAIVLTNVSKDEASPLVSTLNVSGIIVKAHFTPQEVVDTVKQALTR